MCRRSRVRRARARCRSDEREPEEDNHAEHCEEGHHALFDLLGHCTAFLVRDADRSGLGFGRRVGKTLLVDEEYGEREHHCRYRCDERIVDTGVEHFKILAAECLNVAGRISAGGCDERVEVVDVFGRHVVGHAQIFMAERGEFGIVGEIVDTEPPAAEHGGRQRGAMRPPTLMNT